MNSMISKFGLMSMLIASAVTATKADAQAKINVPFSFNIGSISYPAGRYYIERVPLRGFVALENQNGRAIENWTLAPGDPAPSDTRIGLIFDGAENKHVLRAVQYGALITTRLNRDPRSDPQEKMRSHEEN